MPLQQAPRMHQNALLPEKKEKNASPRRNFFHFCIAPPQSPLPVRMGTLPIPHLSQDLRRFGASFLTPSVLDVPVSFHLRTTGTLGDRSFLPLVVSGNCHGRRMAEPTTISGGIRCVSMA